MKVAQIVFSPTGGTQRVADIITSEFGNTVGNIDLTKENSNYDVLDEGKCDIAVIAVPSYGGRAPILATQRLSALRGNNIKCIIVCVYGNRAYEDTLVELNDVAIQCGFNVVAAISAVAEHSIIHKYATGRPDAKDIEELRGFVKVILKKIENGNKSSALNLLGNRPYKKVAGAGLLPKADKKCNNCGLCADICPAQAISLQNLKISDSKKCISCMRCVTQCPQAARKVNGAMVFIASLAIKKACSERKNNELYMEKIL